MSKKSVGFRMKPDSYAKLEKIAETERRTISQVLGDLVDAGIERRIKFGSKAAYSVDNKEG